MPPPQHVSFIANLAVRERYRDEYWRAHDPIADDRVLWRAQAVRHTVHLLPGQAILELGCGNGRFTRALLRVSRNQNPITAVTFQSSVVDNSPSGSKVELLQLSEFPGQLKGRRFDYIVAMDLLDRTTSSELLESVYELLTPGGEMVFYESNPWNPVHKLRALVLRLFGKRDPRNLINKPNLYELLSELGFVRTYAVFNDFVFAPLTRPLIWFLRNASILLENTPGLRTMAGSILIHAQKPPRRKELPVVSLFEHESLRGAVSVVIPSHNEEMNIRPLVERILTLYGEYIHEIIPVNDGSKDRTGEVINDLAAKDNRVKPLHRAPPNGVGLAIADGLAVASGKYVLTMDCDFQHLLPEFRDLLDGVAEGYDVVIGSRFSRHSVLLNYPFMKIFANRAFHAIAVLLFGRRFRDVTNNLKIHAPRSSSRPAFKAARIRGKCRDRFTTIRSSIFDEASADFLDQSHAGDGSFFFPPCKGWRRILEVLIGLWFRCTLGVGPYRELTRRHPASLIRPHQMEPGHAEAS